MENKKLNISKKNTGLLLLWLLLVFCPITLHAQNVNSPFGDKLKQKIVYLEKEPRSFGSQETINFKPEEALPIYGMMTNLCFGIGGPLNPQKNPEQFRKNQEIILSFISDLSKSNLDNKNDVIKLVYINTDGGQGTLQQNTGGGIPMPTVTDWESGIVQMGACFPIDPISNKPVSSIDIKFLKSVKSDKLFWVTSNQYELMDELMAQESKEDERKIILKENEQLYKANEAIAFPLEEPLPVFGKQTSLCFVVGQEKKPDFRKIKEKYLGVKDNSKSANLEGYAESVDGEKHLFREILGSAWEMVGFSGNVKVCTQLVGVSVGSKSIKKISLMPKIDIKALSVEWNTSNSMEVMEEVWQEEKEEAKTRPFIPTPLYKEFVKLFPNNGEQGETLLNAPSISLISPKDVQNRQSIYGLNLSFSDSQFFITPRDNEYALDHSIGIGNENIHSCTARFFGSSRNDAIFVIEDPAFVIEMDYGDEFIEWCWKNKIPVLSQQEFSNWYYKKNSLPKTEDESQFDSLEGYKKHLEKSCGCK